MTASAPLILYDSTDSVATITLNRPKQHNALNPDICVELAAAWRRFNDSDDRVAILTGAGKSFCAGADLTNVPDLWRCVPGVGIKVAKPVVAAVRGWCVGAGVVLVQMCDLCVAAEGTRFSYPEAIVGLTGGLVASIAVRMPHKVAMELLLTGDEMSVQRAYEVGFVNKLVTEAELMDAARRYATRLAGHAPMVLETLKEFVGQTLPKGPTEQAGIARAWTERIIESRDFAEGRAAFQDKRPPKFEGR
ncbi:MAG: enoyl-CoA hydratase/isomerase family protein [Alphaproteobacteria bacterium]|nr:enoyl-CoA hydratase/isomerase family protein [Alphaproteobacteria bacterium]